MKQAHRGYHWSQIPLVVLIILSLTGCGGTPSPTPMPPSETPTPSATPTLTRTPTVTFTVTPSPTPTQTPTPTATPEGFYELTDTGLSLRLPPNWVVDEEDINTAALLDPSGMLLLVFSFPEEEPSSIDGIINAIFSVDDKPVPMTISERGMMPVGLNMQAQYVQATVAGQGIETRVVYVNRLNRGNTFAFITPQGEMKLRMSTVEWILKSVKLEIPRVFDLPRDKTLVMLGGEPEVQDLDPATSTTNMGDYVGLLYSGLVRLTPALQIEPELAEKWSVSADGTVYTFTLRKGLKFNSGKEISAQDVKNSWERALDPAIESSTARSYLGDILGAKEKLDGQAEEVTGIRVVDDLTLEVTLDGPKVYFLAKLTYPTAAVVNVDSLEGKVEDWAYDPDSSGPYQVKEYRPYKTMIFEPNPNAAVPAKIPYIAFIMEPGGSGISLFEDETIDILPLGNADYSRASDEGDPLNSQFHTVPAMCNLFVRFNNQVAPMDDPLVRKAFTMAVDQEMLVTQLTEETGRPAVGLLPESMPGFLVDREGYAYDPEGARAALAESSYAGKLPKVVIAAGGYADSDRMDINLLIEMWQKNLGLPVEVEFLDPANLTEAAFASKAQLLLYGWCADYPDPENFLDILLHSESEYNVGHTNNADLDGLLEEARIEADGDKRLKLYQEAETLALEDFQLIPLLYSNNGYLVNPRIQGFRAVPLGVRYIPYLSIMK